jgi:predicted Rossmann-fold nucleotide-binding protein
VFLILLGNIFIEKFMDIDYSSPVTFQPVRNSLYTGKELTLGFDPKVPDSVAQCVDFKTYAYFVRNGSSHPSKPYAGIMEALHDNSILLAMYNFISAVQRPTAAIMGGHSEDRGSEVYKSVVSLSKRLTEEGFLMASGGGPGAMEATHLGACLAWEQQSVVDDAIALLMTQAKLPDSTGIIDSAGNIDTQKLRALHAWTKPAYELMLSLQSPEKSLGVPTWLYGHEPVTPLATHVAKYFQNSIREDVLLGMATNGIVFAEGAAGTVQEVFQNAAQNFYHDPSMEFAPMVFLGKKFWQEDFPVEPVLKALAVKSNKEDAYKAKVRFFDTIDEIVEFLLENSPSHEKSMAKFCELRLDGSGASGQGGPMLDWTS